MPREFTGKNTHIGVFDSGLGGLSVLRALHARLPEAELTYVADSGHAPYGERDDDFIAERSHRICAFLLARQVDVIVVACNTATAAAIHLIRQTYPHVPVVGVEPGVKPAVAHSHNKRVGVLATPSTLSSDKYKRLIESYAQGALIVPQPCPGLAREIETGELDTPALRALVERFSAPLKLAEVDTVVLGCTHYPFVRPLFAQALGPDVVIMDTADAVAAHTARLCSTSKSQKSAKPEKVKASRSINNKSPSEVHLFSSGNPSHLAEVANKWLGLEGSVSSFD
mgnify:CR=1 FL=1